LQAAGGTIWTAEHSPSVTMGKEGQLATKTKTGEEEKARNEVAEKARCEELMARFGIDTADEFEAQEALLHKWGEQWPEESVSVSEVEQLRFVGFAQVTRTSQQELQEARAQQDFVRCKKLQQKIKENAKAREVCEELQRCIQVGSMLIDAALEKDDYDKCEKMKARVAEMQKGLGEAQTVRTRTMCVACAGAVVVVCALWLRCLLLHCC
jgi:hypothetical protein